MPTLLDDITVVIAPMDTTNSSDTFPYQTNVAVTIQDSYGVSLSLSGYTVEIVAFTEEDNTFSNKVIAFNDANQSDDNQLNTLVALPLNSYGMVTVTCFAIARVFNTTGTTGFSSPIVVHAPPVAPIFVRGYIDSSSNAVALLKKSPNPFVSTANFITETLDPYTQEPDFESFVNLPLYPVAYNPEWVYCVLDGGNFPPGATIYSTARLNINYGGVYSDVNATSSVSNTIVFQDLSIAAPVLVSITEDTADLAFTLTWIPSEYWQLTSVEEYWIYESVGSSSVFTKIGVVTGGGSTQYTTPSKTIEDVGTVYSYYVVAVSTNADKLSPKSNILSKRLDYPPSAPDLPKAVGTNDTVFFTFGNPSFIPDDTTVLSRQFLVQLIDLDNAYYTTEKYIPYTPQFQIYSCPFTNLPSSNTFSVSVVLETTHTDGSITYGDISELQYVNTNGTPIISNVVASVSSLSFRVTTNNESGSLGTNQCVTVQGKIYYYTDKISPVIHYDKFNGNRIYDVVISLVGASAGYPYAIFASNNAGISVLSGTQ